MPLNSNSAAGPGAGASGMDANANGYGGYESDGSYGSDGDGDGGFGDYGGGDDDGDDGGYGGAGGYGDADGGGGGGGGDGEGVGPISLEDAFREKPQTYEDVCRSHIVSQPLPFPFLPSYRTNECVIVSLYRCMHTHACVVIVYHSIESKLHGVTTAVR